MTDETAIQAAEAKRQEIRIKATSIASDVLRTNSTARHDALKKLGADDETIGMIEVIDELILKVRSKGGDVVVESWGLGCGGIAC